MIHAKIADNLRKTLLYKREMCNKSKYIRAKIFGSSSRLCRLMLIFIFFIVITKFAMAIIGKTCTVTVRRVVNNIKNIFGLKSSKALQTLTKLSQLTCACRRR